MFTRIFSPIFICIYASIGYGLCLLSDKFWLAELAIHWRVHMAVASLLFVIAFILAHRLLPIIWMLALTLSFAFPTVQAFAPAPNPEGVEKAKLTILQFNVLYSNKKFSDSIPWIIEQNADVVVLQEINITRALELKNLQQHYAWSQIKLNKNREAFGMAIFSKQPIAKFDYVDIGDGWNHYSLTELLIAGIKLHLYELHTPPPISEEFFAQRNIALKLMADILAKDTTQHRLLVGDLNCTIHSPYFHNIITSAKLHHAQQNYNMEGTWPTASPMPLRIGIDHILASKQIKIEKRVVEPAQNSDHLPVLTTLSLYE